MKSQSPTLCDRTVYRFFHKITIGFGFEAPVRRAILFVSSMSAASTILADCTNPTRIDVDRTHEISTPRSRRGTPRSQSTP
jgi:hypothetical protein